MGIVDDIIREPRGGAHRRPEEMGERLSERLISELDAIVDAPIDDLLEARYQKFRKMGTLFADSLPEESGNTEPNEPRNPMASM
jgi:acetyl-CoA carboxylase alpha subunit